VHVPNDQDDGQDSILAAAQDVNQSDDPEDGDDIYGDGEA